MMIPEMNALREWEDKHERELEELVRSEETAKKERRVKAAEELRAMTEQHYHIAQKRVASNRCVAKSHVQEAQDAASASANPWERVATLIDTGARTSDDSCDISRMRTLLIQLKSHPVNVIA